MIGAQELMRRVRRPGWRRRAARGPSLAPAVLLITSRHRLWQRYGADGLAAIERSIGDLCDAMALRGLAGTLLYTDDSPLATCLGVLPSDPRRPESVAQLVRQVADRLRWTEEQARYVLILGDDGVVPFHRLPNPSPDGDEVMLSDHPYGTDESDPLSPVRAVGRIPDLGLKGLIAMLEACATAHRTLAAGGSPRLLQSAHGYAASVWRGAARAVFEAIGAPEQVRLSPPLTDREWSLAQDPAARYWYFNLHGVPGSPCWFGQRHPSYPGHYPAFPVALRAEELPLGSGAVVVSEACYGAQLPVGSPSDAVASACLAKGALAFVGATGVAYGGLEGGPLYSADFLAWRFWQALRRGRSAGEALADAKRSLVTAALATQGCLDSEDEKAVFNFVLYGDPSLPHVNSERRVVTGQIGEEADSVAGTGPADTVGDRPVRPSHLCSEALWPASAEVPSALLERVREVVARRLPEFAASDVQLSASPLSGRVWPKQAENGRVAASQQLVVVTLRRRIQFCQGPWCSEIVRATVDMSGRVVKLAVSR